jgi:hypothetical protein
VTIFNDDFAEEMQKISSEHGFWVKTMSNVLEQKEMENDTNTIVRRVMSSRASSRQRDPAHTATKGIRELIVATSGPFVKTSIVKKNHDNEQGNIRLFFYRNLRQCAWKSTMKMKNLKYKSPSKVQMHQPKEIPQQQLQTALLSGQQLLQSLRPASPPKNSMPNSSKR